MYVCDVCINIASLTPFHNFSGSQPLWLDTDEQKMALRAWNVSGAFEKRAPGPLSFAIFFATSLHLRHPFVHMTNIIEFVFFKTPPPSLDSVLTPARLYGYVSWGSNQIYSAWLVTKFA